MVYAFVETASVHYFNILFQILKLPNFQIPGEKYITHDSKKNLHQSENQNKLITPKSSLASTHSHEPTLTNYLNICSL